MRKIKNSGSENSWRVRNDCGKGFGVIINCLWVQVLRDMRNGNWKWGLLHVQVHWQEAKRIPRRYSHNQAIRLSKVVCRIDGGRSLNRGLQKFHIQVRLERRQVAVETEHDSEFRSELRVPTYRHERWDGHLGLYQEVVEYRHENWP